MKLSLPACAANAMQPAKGFVFWRALVSTASLLLTKMQKYSSCKINVNNHSHRLVIFVVSFFGASLHVLTCTRSIHS